MERKTFILEPLIEKAENYAKTSFELYKLKAINQSAKVISSFVFSGIVVIFISMFLVIANIGLSFWVGDLLGKVYYGFFCVAGFYFLVGAIVYLFMHKYIKKRVSNSVISQLLK